MLLTDYPHL